jgi:Ser/Thr protein kinase RdoA (MazF antagonist)
MLMRDGGARLRDLLVVEPDLGHWARLLARYAELQIALSGAIDELLALGAPDRRPAALPDLYAELLADVEALGEGRAEGLGPEELVRLRALAPRVADSCALLAASSVPDSLHHGDLHDGNIFVDAGRYRLFDWGDCSLSHPFVGLRTPMVSVENTFGLAEGAPEFGPLRDAFLEPWTGFAPMPALREAFAVGARLAPLVSALGWRRNLASLSEAERAGYRHAVPSLLRELLGGF